MRAEWAHRKGKNRLVSILLVWTIVVTTMVVIFPLTAHKAKGQYIHDTGSAMMEDGGPNDADSTINMVVVWANDDDHFITTLDYVVEPGYTLIIRGLPSGLAINFQDPAVRIIVQQDAKLVTNDNGDPFTRTQLIGTGIMGFDGIFFEPDSEGRIVDCEIQNSINGVVFTGARLMAPGIYGSRFLNTGAWAVQMNYARNYTNIADTTFDDSASPSGGLLDVRNGSLNLTSGGSPLTFMGHSSILPMVYVSNANVTFNNVYFDGLGQQGNSLIVEGASNDTVLIGCNFRGGMSGYHYVKSNGASFLMDNCTFRRTGTSTGALTLEAHDLEYDLDVFYRAHVILRNPINGTGDWENSTIDATGDSSIILQWWIDVEVRDRDGHNIAYVPVYVKDRLDNPGSPPSRLTDINGWARWFLITELIQYESMIDKFNPHDISAQNGSLWGYADYENSTITKSRDVLVIVPSSPPPPPAPPPPIGLSAELTGSAWNVTLSWNASLDDGAGENDVAGYTVYKSSTGINGTYEFAAWIPANGSSSYSWTDIGAGDWDWDNYFYIVRANDTSGNEEQNTGKAGKFVKFLFKDWNLISVPLIQTNTSRDHVLRTLEDNYFSVQGYHAGKSRPWLHWFKDKPHYFNDVIDIDHKNGYYIGMKNPDYLVVAGRVPSSTQIQLKTGWNLVGFPSLANRTRDDALSSIAGNYNMVLYFDTKIKKEIRLGPDDYMEPGFGYWIHATSDCVLEIFN